MTNTRSTSRARKAASKPALKPVPPSAPIPLRLPAANCDIEIIGPDEALSYLECNTHNRRISQTKVKQYAARMTAGRWLFSGQAHVIFSDEGVLLNGQHTLWAVVESGVAIITVVVRGVKAEAFNVIDIGLKRSAGVLLAADGVRGAADIGAAIRTLIVHDRGLKENSPVDNDEIVDLFAVDPEMWDKVREILTESRLRAGRSGPSIGSRASIGAFLALAERAGHDLDDVAKFVYAVSDDVDHEPGKPATTLRRYLIRPGKQRQLTLLSAWIKAWNAHQEGVSFQKLYAWTGIGDNFPEVR